MKSNLILITALTLLSFIFCLACGGNSGGVGTSTSGIKLNEPVQFTIKTYDGDVLKPEDFRGKVLMVDYWATWCAPCRAEFPHFEKLLETYGDELAIIGITTDTDMKALDSFLADNTVPFIVGLEEGSEIKSWDKVPAMPTTFFIDRDGILVSMLKGGHKYDEINAKVEPLIKKAPTIKDEVPTEPTG
jgi:thiol-disulfide isomerase/thioredoxin